jgi:mono/diheme cytochrome c family protein
MRLMRSGFLVGALVCTLLACGGVPRTRDGWLRRSAEGGERSPVQAGRELFLGYCASCHGGDARGQGPVASMLKVPPADLTRIALRHGGRFEPYAVAAFIDGRTDVAAHGRREMPVWGRVYDDRNENIMSEETLLSPAMISAIISWLESVQVAGG